VIQCRRSSRLRYQTQLVPVSALCSGPAGPGALVPRTCSGPGPARTCPQPKRGKRAAIRLRVDSRVLTSSRISAMITAAVAGIHKTTAVAWTNSTVRLPSPLPFRAALENGPAARAVRHIPRRG